MSRRRGKHEEGGAHGGSWKIALADLMTVLMVFFLVMWLMAVVEPEERQAFVDGIGGVQTKDVKADLEEQIQPQEELIQLDLKPTVSKAEIEAAMQNVDPKDISIEETEEFTRITLKSDSFFESGRAGISDKTRQQIEQLGETLAGRGQEMLIAGFTDDRPINNFQFPSNWELSAARAATVARTFIYMGVEKSQVRIEGNADNQEVAPNDTAYGRSLNRRVIITIKKN